MNIVGGINKTLPVQAQGSITIGNDGKLINKISSEMIIPPFAYANVKYGDKVGEMRWYYDGRYIGSIDIKAMKNAEYKTIKSKEKSCIEKVKDFLFN